jgi:hypothetical protein
MVCEKVKPNIIIFPPCIKILIKKQIIIYTMEIATFSLTLQA